jgi:hypothetical protein
MSQHKSNLSNNVKEKIINDEIKKLSKNAKDIFIRI